MRATKDTRMAEGIFSKFGKFSVIEVPALECLLQGKGMLTRSAASLNAMPKAQWGGGGGGTGGRRRACLKMEHPQNEWQSSSHQLTRHQEGYHEQSHTQEGMVLN